jgi:hypothetical protein
MGGATPVIGAVRDGYRQIRQHPAPVVAVL